MRKTDSDANQTVTQRGFSLVELSIVLVILGLLVGGVLSGQSLIRAAELRSVSADIARYSTAIYSFRDKYFALPGDMSNATAFWGKDNAACSGDTGTIATPGTCNGDGNGTFNFTFAAGATNERYQFWKQLALAGLIEGSYSGIQNPTTTFDSLIGVNVPRSRISNSGFSISTWNNTGNSGDLYNYAVNYGNHLQYGTSSSGNNATTGVVLKPEELWNIDTKMDDGRSSSGKLYAVGVWGACTLSTNAVDFSANYNLSNNTVVCSARYTVN